MRKSIADVNEAEGMRGLQPWKLLSHAIRCCYRKADG